MFTIEIDNKLLSVFSNVKIGYVIADVKVDSSYDRLKDEIKINIENIFDKMTVEDVRENIVIKSTKNAYRKLGKDPNRYRPAAESLLRRVVQGKGLYEINNVVDLLNFISIKTGFSICGYDYNKIKGNIKLKIGENEIYEGIGRGELNIENLPVFVDDIGLFGSLTSDSVRTMIDDETTKILFLFPVFENLDEELKEVISQCVEMFEKHIASQNILFSVINGIL